MTEHVKKYTKIRYAESDLAESGIFRGGDSAKTLPISFTLYLLETESHLVLADAGCDELEGFEMRKMIGPVGGLKQYGVKPEEITDVIITHAHADHIAGLKHFPHARVYIQEEEYACGRASIPDTCEVFLFQEECDVADCIHVKKIAGHSVGSCIITFHYEGEAYLITGDEVYSSECFARNIPTGASICPERSQNFIEQYGNGKYKILACHDF